jgi:hypothetical protein
MDRAIEKINQILIRVKKERSLHNDTAPRLVSLFREYIEANTLKHKYKTAMFYGNWNVHPDLVREPVPTILTNIIKIIGKG